MVLADRETFPDQIANIGPVVLNFDVYENFKYNQPGAFDGNGVHVNPSGSKVGGHGVVIVGYKDDSINYPTHDGYWICKNSWGSGWGPWGNGYFGIAYTVAGIEREMSWVTCSDTSNNPPTAYIDSISPNQATEGQTVTFTGHGEDDGDH